jgi:hypothetical protein
VARANIRQAETLENLSLPEGPLYRLGCRLGLAGTNTTPMERIVPKMRLVPVSRNMAIHLATAALLPMLPLILLVYPFAALATKVFEGLLGL